MLEVRTDKGLEFIGPFDILHGILQGDSFCVTLFIMGLNPVAWFLRSTEGYKMSTMKEKITHLMFVDDLKKHFRNQNKNLLLFQTR